MSLRAYLSLALLVVMTAFERTAHYAARSVFFLHLISGEGMTSARAAGIFAVTTALSYAMSLAGGAVAILVGPRAVAAVGALLATFGAVLLAMGVPATVPFAIFAIGGGLFRPCPWAAAAEVITNEDRGPDGTFAPSPRRFAAVAAVTVAMYAAINVGAGVAPALGGALGSARGVRTTFGLSAGLYFFAFLAAAGAAALGFFGGARTRDRAEAAAPYRGGPGVVAAASTSSSSRAFAGLAVLAAPTLLALVGSTLAYNPDLRASAQWIQVLDPIVSVLFSLVLCGLWVAATIGRWSLPPVVVWGGGIAVLGLGLFPLAAGVRGSDAIGAYAIGLVLMAIGDTAATPIAYAYASLSTRRGATLAVAVFASLGYLSSLTSSAVGSALQPVLLVACGLFCVAAGIAVAVLGRRLHGSCFADVRAGAPAANQPNATS